MSMTLTCHACGYTNQLPDGPVSRSAECDKCRRDLRVCKNCNFHDPKLNNECREPQAERVRERDARTDCDYFRPRSATSIDANSEDPREAARKKLDDLFK